MEGRPDKLKISFPLDLDLRRICVGYTANTEERMTGFTLIPGHHVRGSVPGGDVRWSNQYRYNRGNGQSGEVHRCFYHRCWTRLAQFIFVGIVLMVEKEIRGDVHDRILVEVVRLKRRQLAGMVGPVLVEF